MVKIQNFSTLNTLKSYIIINNKQIDIKYILSSGCVVYGLFKAVNIAKAVNIRRALDLRPLKAQSSPK